MSLVLACLLALSASAAPEFRVDPALVDSLSDAPPGLMRAEPYLIHFRKGRLNLYYVSARHESRDDSGTFVLIRRAFAAFPLRRVVVEGRRNHEGDVSSEDARGIIREAKDGRYKWGEGAYAIALAHKKGIRAIGGEPRERDVLLELRRAGFETEDVLGLGFVNMIPAYRDQGRLTADGPEALFAETMAWKRRELGVPAGLSFDFAAFGRWHEARTGAPFDAAKVDYEALRPDPKGSFFQRLADATSNARNRFLAEVITREVRKHAHLLVVYGSGHHAAQRRALIAAFGEPVYEGALSD
ncbi:MAG: hypothetical protein NUW21_14185 [Elusimicrobia bacterium]|nr:hypothetical protein [Elusimicrobiota bacterium]